MLMLKRCVKIQPNIQGCRDDDVSTYDFYDILFCHLKYKTMNYTIVDALPSEACDAPFPARLCTASSDCGNYKGCSCADPALGCRCKVDSEGKQIKGKCVDKKKLGYKCSSDCKCLSGCCESVKPTVGSAVFQCVDPSEYPKCSKHPGPYYCQYDKLGVCGPYDECTEVCKGANDTSTCKGYCEDAATFTPCNDDNDCTFGSCIGTAGRVPFYARSV